jgi:hypothetical protein
VRSDDGFDDVGGVSPVLGPVGDIDRVGVFLDLDQLHVFGDASHRDAGLMAILGTAKPGC